MLDSSLAALALLLRNYPHDWQLLDEILVEDRVSEKQAAGELTKWAREIAAGEGVWAPRGAFNVMVTGERNPQWSVRLWGCFIGIDG